MSEAVTTGPAYYRQRYFELKAQAQRWAETRGEAVIHGNPAELTHDVVVHREGIPGGWYWPCRLQRGQSLRIANPTGRSCVSAMIWNADDTAERFNAADTLKIQWTARLTRGRVLFSDMGRVLASITDDTYGFHDALVGGSSRRTNLRKYGDASLRNTQDNFLLAAAKLGMGPRDVPPCISFFAPVQVIADSKFAWAADACPPGAFVDLRAEMNLLVVLSNCPHPLDPAPAYAPGIVQAVIWNSPPPAADDYCRTATEEAVRGFENTDPLFGHVSDPIYEHVVPALAPWSHIVRRGQTLRIVDLEGQQAVDTLFWNAHDHGERYSAQDTLLEQGSAYIQTGTRLISNWGNVMLTLVADSCGQHDTSAGACSCEANEVRFGHHTRYEHACRENFVLELARHGMSKIDIVSNINFFMNVPILPTGELAIVDGVSKAGDHVDLVAEMDVLCAISNCPQINNPCNGFNPTPIQILIWDSAASR